MNKNSILIIFNVLIGFNVLAWMAVWDLGRGRELEVTFFDVGQGDAIFIETPQGHQILIDGGPSSIILEKLAKEIPFWDRSIDLIILTHPDKDHMMGLIEVLKRYRVEKILWTGIIKDTPEYQEWFGSIKKENASIFIAQIGQKIIASEAVLDVFWPSQNLKGKRIKNDDNTSVVVKLTFGRISILFPGDIYKSVEEELINKNLNLDSDILKIAHHGSKTSTSRKFLKAVTPELAIISLSRDNPYGHPHLQTLENLEGIEVLRTDLIGDIKIISDGLSFEIKTR